MGISFPYSNILSVLVMVCSGYMARHMVPSTMLLQVLCQLLSYLRSRLMVEMEEER